jgi:hypothetical protein
VLYDAVCNACVAPLIGACGKVWGSTGRVPVSAAVVLGLSWQRPDALVHDLLLSSTGYGRCQLEPVNSTERLWQG